MIRSTTRARLDALHRRLSRSPVFIRLALKARNQANCILAAHLGESTSHDHNGEALLVRTVAPHVSSFVDVGANTGEWVQLVLRAGRPDLRGLCFEPNQALHPQLRRALGSARVDLSSLAVSDRQGVSPFYLDPASDQLSRMVTRESDDGVTMVATTTLDLELERHGLTGVDLVKIDAEGHDLHVLRGLSGTLGRRAVGVVQFEYGDRWPAAGSTLAAALDLLATSGYATYRLSSRGLECVAYETYGEHFRYSNYVAVSPSAREWVRGIVESAKERGGG